MSPPFSAVTDDVVTERSDVGGTYDPYDYDTYDPYDYDSKPYDDYYSKPYDHDSKPLDYNSSPDEDESQITTSATEKSPDSFTETSSKPEDHSFKLVDRYEEVEERRTEEPKYVEPEPVQPLSMTPPTERTPSPETSTPGTYDEYYGREYHGEYDYDAYEYPGHTTEESAIHSISVPYSSTVDPGASSSSSSTRDEGQNTKDMYDVLHGTYAPEYDVLESSTASWTTSFTPGNISTDVSRSTDVFFPTSTEQPSTTTQEVVIEVISCSPGYIRTVEGKCADIDECAVSNGRCQHFCVNTEGSYYCRCQKGFEADVPGGRSYYCRCQKGFEADVPGGRFCVDVDECSSGIHNCEGTCVNVPGSFRCQCPVEFQSDSFGTCNDIDECSVDPSLCPNGQCVNTPGSHICQCDEGYQFLSNTCVDIDECRTSPCSESQTCENIPGSYKCVQAECPSGFELINDRCFDVNECLTNNGGCDHLDATSCEDIDECASDNGQCEHGCVNTEGSYFCTCDDDFEVADDGKTCRQKQGRCLRLPPPLHGTIHCQTVPDESNTYPAGTWCKVVCDPGRQVRGDVFRICKTDGEWLGSAALCLSSVEDNIFGTSSSDPLSNAGVTSATSAAGTVSLSCPTLEPPSHGFVRPSRCQTERGREGDQCTFSCESGFKLTQTDPNTKVEGGGGHPHYHSRSYFRCSYVPRSTHAEDPASIDPRYTEGTYQDLHTNELHHEVPQPFIKCPADVTKKLRIHQTTARVTFPPPKSNVDRRFISASPSWARLGVGDVPAGMNRVTFKARSPVSNVSASCSFFIHVIDAEPPTVFGCPASFDVVMDDNALEQRVTWEEPIFQDNIKVVHVWKNKPPGAEFGEGKHKIFYVAADEAGNRARCNFNIDVKLRGVCPPLNASPYTIMNCTTRSWGKSCKLRCSPGFTFFPSSSSSSPLPSVYHSRLFICGKRNVWLPREDPPACVPVSRITPNGCLSGYQLRGTDSNVCAIPASSVPEDTQRPGQEQVDVKNAYVTPSFPRGGGYRPPFSSGGGGGGFGGSGGAVGPYLPPHGSPYHPPQGALPCGCSRCNCGSSSTGLLQKILKKKLSYVRKIKDSLSSLKGHNKCNSGCGRYYRPPRPMAYSSSSGSGRPSGYGGRRTQRSHGAMARMDPVVPPMTLVHNSARNFFIHRRSLSRHESQGCSLCLGKKRRKKRDLSQSSLWPLNVRNTRRIRHGKPPGKRPD
ncbi:unnamed protein product [Cyprideis torosa]|uniref:Uncharacterized protein n=1 Tax=Cyprideis torosa TaxID=163714 RepID=A0A7R8WF73_9CRUS|nr:unnamed protein product [Cyprideis torosa]CAG0896480.1 unnamed protein product [Cyprideis torosa]